MVCGAASIEHPHRQARGTDLAHPHEAQPGGNQKTDWGLGALAVFWVANGAEMERRFVDRNFSNRWFRSGATRSAWSEGLRQLLRFDLRRRLSVLQELRFAR